MSFVFGLCVVYFEFCVMFACRVSGFHVVVWFACYHVGFVVVVDSHVAFHTFFSFVRCGVGCNCVQYLMNVVWAPHIQGVV